MNSIGIVIPAYNEELDLRRCLESIAKQSVMPNEVIVVDNNSTDRTVAVAQSFPFVTVIHEPVQGINAARNAGFNLVRSDIIARIDADTRLPKNWVEYVLHYYSYEAHNQRAVSGSGYFYNLFWPRPFGRIQQLIAFKINRALLGHNILWGSNMAIPRSVWNAVRDGVCAQTNIHEDIDLAIHTTRAGYRIDFRRGMTVGVRMHRVHTDRSKLWSNLMMWPRTLRTHSKPGWILAFTISVVMFIVATPLRLIERLALASSRHPRTNVD